MRIFTLVSVFILSIPVSHAQTGKIFGNVTDELNQPIVGASVIYKKEITIGVFTDFDGNYELELPVGEALIVARATGLISDTTTILVKEGERSELNFKLVSYIKELGEVDIRVGKFDRPLEENTVSMEIIRPELIENKNTRSIETALDQTPGLNILDGEPQIRGGSGFTFGVGSKVAVIVDDMPMLSGDAGRPEWGFIPVENISQIEVIKGASSVLSGSSALAGAIHIRTAYPKSKPLTKVNVYSGFYSAPEDETMKWWNNTPLITGANFLHSRQIKNLDLVIGGNANYDHGYIGPPLQDTALIAAFPELKDSISDFTEAQMSSKRVRLNFNTRYRSKKFRGLNYGVNGNVMYSETNLAFAWLDDTSGLYRAYPGAVFLQDQFIFNVDPYVNFFTLTEGKHHFRTRVLHTDNELTANQSNRSTVYYADYMFQRSYAALKNLDFIGGITGKYTSSIANMYSGTPNDSTNEMLNISAYSQIERKVADILKLSIGGRLEYFELNDTITLFKPIFRAGASLKLYQETYLRGSYGQGLRFPTITERYIKTGIGNFGVFPNPQLKPEYSWNAEVGIKQGIKIGGVYGYLDIAGFWQEYENTIEYLFGFWGDDFSNPSGIAGFKFLNTGRSRVLGLDISFSGKMKAGKNLTATYMTGYNYIVPKTLNPDLVYAVDMAPIPREYSYNSTSLDSASGILKYRFLNNVKADIEFMYKKKFAIGFSVKYFSKIINMDGVISDFEDLTTQFPKIQDILYMDYFNSHRFGNIILDARVSYSINKRHKVALVGANILNRTYSLRPLKIEPPRSIMFQYTFKLDKND